MSKQNTPSGNTPTGKSIEKGSPAVYASPWFPTMARDDFERKYGINESWLQIARIAISTWRVRDPKTQNTSTASREFQILQLSQAAGHAPTLANRDFLLALVVGNIVEQERPEFSLRRVGALAVMATEDVASIGAFNEILASTGKLKEQLIKAENEALFTRGMVSAPSGVDLGNLGVQLRLRSEMPCSFVDSEEIYGRAGALKERFMPTETERKSGVTDIATSSQQFKVRSYGGADGDLPTAEITYLASNPGTIHYIEMPPELRPHP